VTIGAVSAPRAAILRPVAPGNVQAAPSSSRVAFRAFPLDGALLFFQPASGTNVRVESARTRAYRRRAPRVVMFGITNRCNLACDFCSRDVSRESSWTVASAAEVLRGLARAGTLEVAFGGGEPFAFRGFAELVAELHATTPLALNVTTNGTLLDAARFAPFRGLFGQVRISIYDDPQWLTAARALSGAGQLWGANVLVDGGRLAALPELLTRLAELGCHDVSVLGYIGGDPALQLSAAERARLAEHIARAPLPCRVSVCFGASLGVPRLFEGADGGGDCGAGYDFLTVTPDRGVQSCSFQSHAEPAATAERMLEIWQRRRAVLGRASERTGCARLAPGEATRRPAEEVMVWRAFSGNNSGECVLVGKFESGAAAHACLAELKPGWVADGEYSAEWRALFEREGVALAAARRKGEECRTSPTELAVAGRSLLAISYAADDAFPELRAFAWKRAGYVAPGGIHLHEHPPLFAAIRCSNEADARALQAANPGLRTFLHGRLLFVIVPDATHTPGSSLQQHAAALAALAGSRPTGAELVLEDWDEAAFLSAKQRLGTAQKTVRRLFARFPSGDAARRFAAGITEATARAFGSTVLIEGLQRRKRAAVRALRQGADVGAVDGAEAAVHGWFWTPEPPGERGKKRARAVLDLDELRRRFTETLGREVTLQHEPSWSGARLRVTTGDPGRALAALDSTARELGAQITSWVSEADPMLELLRRLIADTE
jgi:MoaA/NifB/PqqE/SkfB family radical SAM enzyme